MEVLQSVRSGSRRWLLTSHRGSPLSGSGHPVHRSRLHRGRGGGGRGGEGGETRAAGWEGRVEGSERQVQEAGCHRGGGTPPGVSAMYSPRSWARLSASQRPHPPALTDFWNREGQVRQGRSTGGAGEVPAPCHRGYTPVPVSGGGCQGPLLTPEGADSHCPKGTTRQAVTMV